MRHEILRQERSIPVVQNDNGHSLLVRHTTRYPSSKDLALGSQRKLVNAAAFSRHIGYPINLLTTINAAHLQHVNIGGIFELGHLRDGHRDLIELMRKWTVARDVPWVTIWVRESIFGKAQHQGEHWHIGHHLPTRHHAELLPQLAVWTGEAVGQDTAENGTVGRSVNQAWHVGTRIRGGNGPEGIAAYLGKAEPNKITHYRKHVPNPHKIAPWHYGGEGLIEGQRMGVSHSLSPEKQRREGFASSVGIPRQRISHDIAQRPAYRP